MRGFKQISAAIFVAAFIVSPAVAEDVIRFKSTGDIRSLDPMENTSLFIRDMGYHIFDTLFSKDSKLQVQPQMVESYNVNGDFTNFSFTLRDGLKFTDGAAVKSADVIASIKRWASKDSMGAEILARLSSLSAVDDKTFELKLNSPFPRLIEAFAKVSNYPLFIMPERIASKPVTERITEIIGSGPYKLVQNEWVPGVKLVLEKNKDYVPRKEPADGLAGGKIAYIERLERITVPDDTSAINALLAGELDYILEFPPQMLPILTADPDIKVGKLTDKTVVLVPNHTQPPFDNLKVRQALQYAFKQEDFLRTQMGDNKDYYKICPAIFQCGFPFETDKGSESFMNPDPVKAKKMLADAGYDGSPVYYLHPMDGFTQRDMGTVAVNDLRRAGFKVEDVQTDNASFLTRRTNKQAPSAGGWSLLLTALPPDYAADPLVNLFTTGACDKAFVGWPCDEKLHDLWKKFLTATPEESKQLAEQMQARAYEIVTVIPMGQYWDLKAWRSEFSGFIDSPVAALWNVRRAK